MTNHLIDRIQRQSRQIQTLEERLANTIQLANKIARLERELGTAKAAVAELKHRLTLIGSEESIQRAIQDHSAGIFFKYTKPSKPKSIRRKKK